MSKGFLVYGALVLAALAFGEYSGYSFSRVTAVKNVPRSVRDNPGSYRPAYHPFFFGGGGYLRGK